MRRTCVRYELKISGQSVHHIRNFVSHIIENYLLYGDILEQAEYTHAYNVTLKFHILLHYLIS